MTDQQKAFQGWGVTVRGSKFHYFENGKSLCRGSVWAGEALPRHGYAYCRLCSYLIAVKPQAQVLANELEQVPAPAPSRDLRLLCLLVPSRTGGTRSLPVHTLRPVPPRVSVQGRWNLASETGFHLRETQATAPSPEVLEHYLRLGQADAFRAYPRAVRTGVSQ